jgi:amino acid adenylation domain-containing protein
MGRTLQNGMELSAAEKRALLTDLLREKAAKSRQAPASFAQQRLWFLDQLEPGGSSYNVPRAVRLKGRLDLPALRRSLNELLARHESLRTNFGSQEGEPVQVIAPARELELPVVDLTTMASAEREVEVHRLAVADSQKPFDLAHDQLLRATLFKVSEQDHVLLLVMHHIISDGWSMGILIRELGVLYEAFVNDRPSPLPALPIQYADFARWQREWLQGDVLEEQIGYWKKQLAGAPATIDLPTDRPRPAVQTFNGAHYARALPKRLRDSLNLVSRREGVTLFMTLLAAFQTLLHRYTNQDDIVVGTPIANRTRRETEELIGFFVNTLMMRSDLSGDPTFRELLQTVKESSLAAYAHQDLPFEKLVEDLNPERSLSHSPLFQVMFALQNAPREADELSELTITRVSLGTNTAKFDLTFFVTEAGDELSGYLEYNTDLFDAVTIERLLRHYEVLLEGIVADPTQRLSQLPLLEPAERGQLLVEWNDTQTQLPGQECPHVMFEAQVERTPDAPAVMFEGRQLTYAELNLRANKLAHNLRTRGVGLDTIVGLACERSLEMVVGVLGVLKAGAAYLPLDASYPSERLAFMLQDAGVKVLLTQEPLVASCPEHDAETILLDAEWPAIEQENDGNPEHRSSAQNLAYVIYTSGSTGQPKGVAMTQGALANMISWQLHGSSPFAPARTLQFASLSFDVSFQEMFSTWCGGGTLFLVTEELRRDAPALLTFLREHEIERIFLPFVYLQHLAEEYEQTAAGPLQLREIITAGEQLEVTPQIARFCESLKDISLSNHYGPSETHVVTAHLLTGSPETWPALPPIGRPISNTQSYVLDKNLEPVPIGVAGELYLGGESVSGGYLNRPDLTASKFRPDPFSNQPGARMYVTGDLARYQRDGSINFLGRIDAQVKIRGFRIEPGEIETLLAAHPAVREAVVVAHEAEGGRRLEAFIVAEPESSGDLAHELRRHLKGTLPDYMIPAVFVLLDSLPLTPSGKIDRRSLPLAGSIAGGTDQYEAPRTDVEEKLAAIWVELLKLERVGIHDNFFEVGGHSLLATRVMSRIQKIFNLAVPLRTLFEAPTVAELAGKIAVLTGAGEQGDVGAITPVPRDRALALSYAQQRLWFLSLLEPNNPAYNMPQALRLKGSLDVRALEQTINAIIARHESLRTLFKEIAGEPVQLISETYELKLGLTDLTGLPGAKRESEAQRLALIEAQRPFDLSHDHPLRASLVKLDDDDHLLLLTMHHIASDGWSMGVLTRELSTIYAAISTSQPVLLPRLPIQYADYAGWQRQQLQGTALTKQLGYWQERLHGAPAVLNLQTDRPRAAEQTFTGAVLRQLLPAQLSGPLNELSRKEGATLFMTLLAAFQTLLFRYTGQEEIVVGTAIAGRNRVEVENLIGLFVNTLALRTSVSGNLTFRELLARARETALGAYAHQDLPFERLVEEINPERNISHTPMFQVMFGVQNAPRETLRLGELEIIRAPLASGTAKFDLTLFLTETEEGLFCWLEYNSDLFEARTVERMLGHFDTLLAGIVADPNQRLAELPLLTEAERQQLLVGWNDTEVEFGIDRCLHQLFEAQVEKTPDTIALICEANRLSYRDLNARANQLARHLRRLGVKPEDRVAICLERSTEMVVAVLATLKSGGAYVPLDPDYPADRLAFMLQDAGAVVLLTQENLSALLPETKARVVCVDTDRDIIAREDESNPAGVASPGNLAYVIYTSGSTGRPKGVQISHFALGNFLHSMRRLPGISGDDVLLSVTTLSFDIAGLEIYLPLIAGARLVLATREVAADGVRLAEALTSSGATIMQATPATWQLLIESGWHGNQELKIFCGGETLSRVLADQLLERGAALWNLYGPTETTIWSTVCRVEDTSRGVQIGRPIANTQVFILDSNLRMVPLGVAGELYIGGDGLARGYLDQPGLSAERFIPDPFSRYPGARLYKTGDLARYLTGCNIEVLGRLDTQVKLRGFRIELGEIEAVLNAHPQVRAAVVLAREDQPGDQRLAVYLVGELSATMITTELRTYLREQLPEYMVPSSYVLLDALPLTPNGKVDRRALPAPERLSPEVQAAYVAPRTEVERIISAIWQEALALDQVGTADNFFDLGGHSLLLVKVHVKLRDVFSKDLAIIDLFRYPTIESLARYLSDEGAETSSFEKIHERVKKQKQARSRRQFPKRGRSE